MRVKPVRVPMEAMCLGTAGQKGGSDSRVQLHSCGGVRDIKKPRKEESGKRQQLSTADYDDGEG
jgi:hypothetical protein